MVKTTLMTDSKCPLVSLTRIVLEMFTETAEKVVGHLAVGYWLSAARFYDHSFSIISHLPSVILLQTEHLAPNQTLLRPSTSEHSAGRVLLDTNEAYGMHYDKTYSNDLQ